MYYSKLLKLDRDVDSTRPAITEARGFVTKLK